MHIHQVKERIVLAAKDIAAAIIFFDALIVQRKNIHKLKLYLENS